MNSHFKIFRLFQNIGRLAEGLRHDGVSTVLGLAMESAEPTIRNSNLFPVNAKGEVLLRSVASFGRSGRVGNTRHQLSAKQAGTGLSRFDQLFTTSSSWSPRNTEIMAGGASLAPSLWSFPTSAAL